MFAAGGICSLEAFTGGAVVPVYYEAHAAALDDLVQKSAEETLTSHLEKIKNQEILVTLEGKEYAVSVSDAYELDRKTLTYIADEEKIRKSIEETGIGDVNTMVESRCEQLSDRLIIHKGQTGVKADMEALEKEILAAVKKGNFNCEISCPVKKVLPQEIDLQSYYDAVFQKPINGEIDKANNYVISSSKDGVSFNLVLAKKRLKQAADGETITIYYEFIQPEICTKALDEKQFRDVLGSYSTYGTGTKGRITNITLAAQSCDGVILMPGDIFSFNDTLGERTEERGYKEATVYINNKSAKGIGGGICQVSSTLFAAVLYADLEIVQRTNHSLTVGYLPLGMDAAVSWGTLDFRFRNNTDYPIRLSVTSEQGNIDVEILGTKETNTTVEITTEELDPLTVKTFRSHYDSAGNLLDTQQVAYSKYQGVH